MEERLQKILAKAGFGSRRACEDIILGGRVRVNGSIARIGSKADMSKDTIVVDTITLPKTSPELVYIALLKPRGVLSDEDFRDTRPTVRDIVDIPGHLFAVGRLDLESEGLLFLTNDGELANRLTHPRYMHEKEYRVLLASKPDAEQLKAWQHGVVLSDGHRTAPAFVRISGTNPKGCWLQVILHEGRKRQIRDTASQLGLYVQRIIRVRISTLLLGELKPGEWRYLTATEVRTLKASTKGDGIKQKNYPANSDRKKPPRSSFTRKRIAND